MTGANKKLGKVPPELLAQRRATRRRYPSVNWSSSGSNTSWDRDEEAFDRKVLNRKCPYCQAPRGTGCFVPASVLDETLRFKKGRFASKFHMDRVYAAYPGVEH